MTPGAQCIALLTTFVATGLAATANGIEGHRRLAIQSGVACDKTSATAATISLKWNAHASEWGAYEVAGCAGVNPKLSLTAGTIYTFDQSDATNWYHPVGFSYIAGGAHTSCLQTDGSAGECPELGGESAGSTLQYYVDGTAVTSDDSGFGLDAYEPLFFNSQDWWGEQPSFFVDLMMLEELQMPPPPELNAWQAATKMGGGVLVCGGTLPLCYEIGRASCRERV